MHQDYPLPDNKVAAQRLAQETAAVRHLEKTGGWSRGERLRFLWYRLRLAVAEMNYASRRMVELQAPWTARRPR